MGSTFSALYVRNVKRDVVMEMVTAGLEEIGFEQVDARTAAPGERRIFFLERRDWVLIADEETEFDRKALVRDAKSFSKLWATDALIVAVDDSDLARLIRCSNGKKAGELELTGTSPVKAKFLADLAESPKKRRQLVDGVPLGSVFMEESAEIVLNCINFPLPLVGAGYLNNVDDLPGLECIAFREIQSKSPAKTEHVEPSLWVTGCVVEVPLRVGHSHEFTIEVTAYGKSVTGLCVEFAGPAMKAAEVESVRGEKYRHIKLTDEEARAMKNGVAYMGSLGPLRMETTDYPATPRMKNRFDILGIPVLPAPSTSSRSDRAQWERIIQRQDNAAHMRIRMKGVKAARAELEIRFSSLEPGGISTESDPINVSII